ncbi:MAG: MATE family efflux transporter, partial [Pseudomonadota bacterium]
TTLIIGSYNGSREYNKVGKVIWNALWLILFFIILLYILFSSELYLFFIADNCRRFGLVYVDIIINYAWIVYINTVFSGFLFAIGKSHIVSYSIWLGTFLNIILNYLLIFIYDYGVFGGAYATVIAGLIQLLILVIYSFKEWKKYHLLNISFNLDTIYDIIYRGSSSALGHGVELLAISFIYTLLSSYGVNNPYLQVGFLINILALVLFNINTGFEKAIGALSSNYIGNKDYRSVVDAMINMTKLYTMMSMTMGILVICFLDHILYFLNFQDLHLDPLLYNSLFYAAIFTIAMAFFDGLAWMTIGVLHSMRDIMFSLIANAALIVLLYVIPTYLFYLYIEHPPYYFVVRFFLFYTIAHFIALFYRFYRIIYSHL